MKNISQSKLKFPKDPSNATPYVEIKTVTWSKDSHGLFDYENSNYDMRKFVITNSAYFYRHNNEIKVGYKDQMMAPEISASDFLLSLSQDNQSVDKYKIDIPGDFSVQSPTIFLQYLIVRSLKCSDGKNQRGYTLHAGCIIKLGRIEYRVLEICNQTESVPESIDYNLYQNESIFDIETQNQKPETSEHLCRICYSDHLQNVPEVDNVMLYMCDCRGSTGGVHYFCLKTWINYKIVSKNHYNNILTYQWKRLECDICLKPYPRRVSYSGKVYEFLAVQKPQTPYIVIEKLMPEINYSSNISIISLEDRQEVKIGRQHVCDLRISDISVSRVHAFLRFSDKKFSLFDNDSKFGTLILLDKDYPVRSEKAAIQIGRTVFTFVVKYHQR